MKQSVIFIGPDISERLRSLIYRVARQTGLEYDEKENSRPKEHDLVWDETKQVFGLKLAPAQPLLTLDLIQNWRFFLAQSQRSKKTPFAKALGKKAFQGGLVWDASGGSGRDLCHLLSLGVERLWVFERHPVVYALLLFEVYQLKRVIDPKVEVEVFHADASSFKTQEFAEVVYFDPMYPEKKKKSSLSRKAMEVFKQLVGPDLDELESLKKLIKSPHKRVVLKRPLKAKALMPGVSSEFKGSTTRYDLYV